MLKKFEQFLLESTTVDLLKPDFNILKDLSNIFYNDLKKYDPIEHVDITLFSDHKMSNDYKRIDLVVFKLTIDIDHLSDYDVPTFFNDIKEYFKQYGYVIMVKDFSTRIYSVTLNYNILKDTNVYKSVLGINKFKLNEAFSDPELNNIISFENYLRKDKDKFDFMPSSYFPRIDLFPFLDNTNKNVLRIEFEINFHKFNVEDIPEYFNKLKDYFKKFFYINMKKGDSTNYYEVYLDYKKLKDSEIFKSILGMNKFGI